MQETINRERRRLLGAAAITIAAAELVATNHVHARSATFGALKQIVLNIGYVDTGPANGPPVILLHGWPYDIHAFIDVAPVLAADLEDCLASVAFR